jgi:hypothetical protein
MLAIYKLDNNSANTPAIYKLDNNCANIYIIYHQQTNRRALCLTDYYHLTLAPYCYYNRP